MADYNFDKASGVHTFDGKLFDGHTISFRESRDENRGEGAPERHPDERFDLVTFVPFNANGSRQSVFFSLGFNAQDVRGTLNAMQRTLYMPLESSAVQINLDMDAEVQRYGRMGWIRFDQLDFTKITNHVQFTRNIREGRKFVTEVQNAFIDVPTEFDADFQMRVPAKELKGEWLELIRKSAFTWTSRWDSTNGNGPALARYRTMLFEGTAFYTAPTIGVLEDGTVLDKLQNNACRFFDTLLAVSKGELSLQEAGHQYFQDRKFVSISYQNDVELDEGDQEVMEENAKRVKEGEEPKLMAILVSVDWSEEKIDVTTLPKGNYTTNLAGANKFQENRSFFGMKRLVKAARDNEQLVLSRTTI